MREWFVFFKTVWEGGRGCQISSQVSPGKKFHEHDPLWPALTTPQGIVSSGSPKNYYQIAFGILRISWTFVISDLLLLQTFVLMPYQPYTNVITVNPNLVFLSPESAMKCTGFSNAETKKNSASLILPVDTKGRRREDTKSSCFCTCWKRPS